MTEPIRLRTARPRCWPAATTVALGLPREPRRRRARLDARALAAYLRERGVETICSFPNEPLEPPRWAALLPGVRAPGGGRRGLPARAEVMVTCDCASADRLGRLRASADARARSWSGSTTIGPTTASARSR